MVYTDAATNPHMPLRSALHTLEGYRQTGHTAGRIRTALGVSLYRNLPDIRPRTPRTYGFL